MTKTIEVEFTYSKSGVQVTAKCPVVKQRKGLALIERVDGNLSITHVASGLMAHRMLLFEAHQKDEALAAFDAVFPMADWTQSASVVTTPELEAAILATFHEGA
ncbi:MAG: hypothetical protein AAGD09_11430 [Cyanobacteria bacterium P01_F01_bin.56]